MSGLSHKEFSRKGGKSKSAKKLAALVKNRAKALAARNRSRSKGSP